MMMTKKILSGWSMTLQLLRHRKNYNQLAPFSVERFPMKLTCVKNSRSDVTGTSYRSPNRRMTEEKTTISWMTSSMKSSKTSMLRSDVKLRDWPKSLTNSILKILTLFLNLSILRRKTQTTLRSSTTTKLTIS